MKTQRVKELEILQKKYFERKIKERAEQEKAFKKVLHKKKN